MYMLLTQQQTRREEQWCQRRDAAGYATSTSFLGSDAHSVKEFVVLQSGGAVHQSRRQSHTLLRHFADLDVVKGHLCTQKLGQREKVREMLNERRPERQK